MSTFLKCRTFDGEPVTQRLYSVLTNTGHSKFSDFTDLSDAYLMKEPNCGRVSLREFKDIMKKKGLSFNPAPPPYCSKCGQPIRKLGHEMTSEEAMDEAMVLYAGAMRRLA